jgi:tRNA (guanine37-N1)-methyltransferase
MQIDIITIFPEMFAPVLGASLIKRAVQAGLLRIRVHDLRDYTSDPHRKVDDRPYGGGPGMVLMPQPIFAAVEDVRRDCSAHAGRCEVVLMTPQGESLSTPLAQQLAITPHLVLLCGHYEGIDERVKVLVTRSVSIGDYVLTGGELPAMVLVDCVARYVPGVIGHAQATEEESFAEGWLEYPQYTRPASFRELEVPEVLLSGDHGRIAQWRKWQAMSRTLAQRPDLMRQRQP